MTYKISWDPDSLPLPEPECSTKRQMNLLKSPKRLERVWEPKGIIMSNNATDSSNSNGQYKSENLIATSTYQEQEYIYKKKIYLNIYKLNKEYTYIWENKAYF